MPEGIDPPVVEPVAPVVTAPVPPGQSTPLVGDDGSLREGWRDTLEEDIRDEPCLKLFDSFNGAMKSVVSAQKAFGKDKIVKPGEASSEAEWDAFHAAGGRPETAGDYAFTRPENLPEEHYSQELATAAQELFHKIGISKRQADALFAFNNNTAIANLATTAQDKELSDKALVDGLHSDWGNAYEQNKHLGNVAVEEGTSVMKDGAKVVDQEFKERLLKKFGDDPDFIRYSRNLGAKFKETGAVTVDLIPTPTDIQSTIDDEIAKPVYGTDYASHGFTKQQHKAQVEKVAALFREKTKHIKTG